MVLDILFAFAPPPSALNLRNIFKKHCIYMTPNDFSEPAEMNYLGLGKFHWALAEPDWGTGELGAIILPLFFFFSFSFIFQTKYEVKHRAACRSKYVPFWNMSQIGIVKCSNVPFAHCIDLLRAGHAILDLVGHFQYLVLCAHVFWPVNVHVLHHVLFSAHMLCREKSVE